MIDRRPSAILLDGLAYGAQLLGDGHVAYQNPAALAKLGGELAQLLRPQAIILHLEDFLFVALKERPDLLQAMAERDRPLFAMRRALGDGDMKDKLQGLLTAFHAIVGGDGNILLLPDLAGMAERLAAAAGVAPTGPADASAAVVYVADFLRALGADALNTLLLASPSPRGAPAAPVQATLANLAAHFGWRIGAFECAAHEALLAPWFAVPPPSCTQADGVEASWAEGDKLFVRIAPHARPESVLDWFSGAREGGIA